jgi:hypothetical protein
MPFIGDVHNALADARHQAKYVSAIWRKLSLPPAPTVNHSARVQPGFMEKETMAKLMKASLWSKREFTKDSIPDNRTIKRWVENGLLMGRIVDGSVFVYETEKWGVDSIVNQAVRQLILRVDHGSKATKKEYRHLPDYLF